MRYSNSLNEDNEIGVSDVAQCGGEGTSPCMGLRFIDESLVVEFILLGQSLSQPDPQILKLALVALNVTGIVLP